MTNLPFTLNLGPFQGGEFAFINLMRTTAIAPVASTFLPSQMDANNYPTGTLATNVNFIVNIPPEYTTPATTWVLDWSGKCGTPSVPGLQISSGGYTVSVGQASFVNGATTSNLNVGGTNGYLEFTMNAQHLGGTLSLNFLSGGVFDGTLSNLRLYRKADQNELATSEFSAVFKNKVKQLKPAVLRFLNWFDGNNSTVFAKMAPRTALGWGAGWFDPNDWVGTATGSANGGTGTDDYVLNLGNTTLTHGRSIHFFITYANTSSPARLSIDNGSTFVNIVDMFGANMTNATGANGGAMSANTFWTAYYDAILGKWMARKGGIFGGVPPSICLDLCKELGVDCWLNIPSRATDAFITSVATDAQSRLAGTPLSAWYELLNELWNRGSAFSSTNYYEARGIALGFPTSNSRNQHCTYALRFRQISDLLDAVYSGVGVKKVLAHQASGIVSQVKTYRFEGATLKPNNVDTTTATFAAGSNKITLASQINPQEGFPIQFTAGTVPSGLSLNTTYYVRNPTDNQFFFLAATPGGTVITFTAGAQSATFSYTNAVYPYGDYTTAGNRPIDKADFTAYAPYFFGAQMLNGPTSTFGNWSTPASDYSSGGPVGYTVGLLGAADDYASGIPANMANALAWVDWDMRQGTKGGVAGTSTLTTFASTKDIGSGPIGLYPSWDAAAASYGKKVALYENAMEALPPSTTRCTAIGINTAYGDTYSSQIITAKGKIRTLLEAYKSSIYFTWLIADQLKQFSSNSQSAYACWYQLCSGVYSSSGVYQSDNWALGSGDINDPMWKSFDAVQLYVNNKRLISW